MESETLSSPVINNAAGREDTGQCSNSSIGEKKSNTLHSPVINNAAGRELDTG